MLIVLAILSLFVFAVPQQFKFWFTLGLVSVGAVVACGEAFSAFGSVNEYEGVVNPLFGASRPAMDPLSALFVVIASLAAVSITIYSKEYVGAYAGKKSPVQISVHYAALALLYFSMIFVVTYRGGFTFLFSWELMTIASFLLILFEGEKREVRRAAINYLVLMHVGFIFILTALVTGAGGTLDGFDALGEYFKNNGPLPLFILFFIGFGMKAGVFPLHIWLPEAHPAAPSHVSALMSGVMIKMGVYGMLRVLSYITEGLYAIGLVMLCVGVVTALWGIILAALQNDLKKLLAYSSIENVGIIFTGLGAGVIGLSSGNDILALFGLGGALLHTVNHSLFKPLLFMSAGSVYLSTHTRNIDELGGLSRRMPITAALFLAGSVAICALPPMNGFVSEFLIYLGLFKSAAAGADVMVYVIAMAVLAMVGGFAVLVFSKAFGITFLGHPRCCKAEKGREAGAWMLCAQMIPLAGMVLIGLFPAPFAGAVMKAAADTFWISVVPYEVSALPALMKISLVMILLAVFVAVIYLVRTRALKRREVTSGPVWGCGFTAPTSRMQYTGESFAEGMQQLSASLTNEKPEGEIPSDGIFAEKYDFGVKHTDRVDNVVSGRWAFFVRKVNARLALFQTGKINHYVLHALLFLAFILLLTLMGII